MDIKDLLDLIFSGETFIITLLTFFNVKKIAEQRPAPESLKFTNEEGVDVQPSSYLPLKSSS